MTPFGLKMRELRAKKGVTLKKMAFDLHVSAAYLSALEHGHRGIPSPGLILQICGYFDIIWDEVEALKKLVQISHPKVTVCSAGLSATATELANRLAQSLVHLPEQSLIAMLDIITQSETRQKDS